MAHLGGKDANNPPVEVRPHEADGGRTHRRSFNLSLAGIGILLVVVGHSSGSLPSSEEALKAANPLYRFFCDGIIRWIYTFHMPLFIFLSAWNFNEFTRRKNMSYQSLVADKAKRLLIPYLAISTLVFPIKAALSGYALHAVQFSVTDFLQRLLIPWDNPIIYFWFMPTLFLYFVLIPVFQFFCKSLFRRVLGGVVFSTMFFVFDHQPMSGDPLRWGNIEGLLHNSIFFFTGLLFQQDMKRYPTGISLSLSLFLLTASIVGFVFFDREVRAVQLLLAALGIAATVFFAATPAGDNSASRFIGGYSYQIYLFSWFFQVPVRIVFSQILDVNILLTVIASALSGLLFPIVLTMFLDRICPKSLSTLYGR